MTGFLVTRLMSYEKFNFVVLELNSPVNMIMSLFSHMQNVGFLMTWLICLIYCFTSMVNI